MPSYGAAEGPLSARGVGHVVERTLGHAAKVGEVARRFGVVFGRGEHVVHPRRVSAALLKVQSAGLGCGIGARVQSRIESDRVRG